MSEKAVAMRMCIQTDDSRCVEYPLETSRFPPSTTSASGTANIAPPGHRDKRRFYVKKTCIGISEFKEWEELLGDNWYRHHNKVNNIVYYHCKHEPCYASMKAKVMVDCVQLYVTEEGHTHPPYANDFTTPLTFSSITTQSGDFESNGFKSQPAITSMSPVQPQKRKRQSEELFQQPSILSQQIFLNELLRMQNDNRDLKVSESSNSCGDNDTPVSTSADVKTELYQATSFSSSEKTNEGSPDSDSIQCADTAASVGIVAMHCNEEPKNLQKPQVSVLENSSCRPSSLSSSPETQQPILTSSSPSAKHSVFGKSTNFRELDEDEGYSNSDDSFDNDIDLSSDRSQISKLKPLDRKDLFSILKLEIEGKPAHRRLQHLRRLKHQLYYFLEMEELKCLASRVPPTTRYEDIFKPKKSS